jgi:hypothetical protein
MTTPTAPFNPTAHDFLIGLGFEVTRVDASWEDSGDAENGPRLTGGPAFDEYTHPDGLVVYIAEDGRTGYEYAQLDFDGPSDPRAR